MKHTWPNQSGFLPLVMVRMKIYTAEYIDTQGVVRHDFTFQAMNPKEARAESSES
jgi:hypothetical protein